MAGQRTKIGLILIEAVDETLEMLGRKTKPQVYKYLEKKFGLVRDEILRSPETFSMGLVSLFGSASKQLEVAIIRRFHDKLGIKFESSETFNFVDCVATLLT